nr:hypothetical protein [Actinoplanes polyasparticus]
MQDVDRLSYRAGRWVGSAGRGQPVPVRVVVRQQQSAQEHLLKGLGHEWVLRQAWVLAECVRGEQPDHVGPGAAGSLGVVQPAAERNRRAYGRVEHASQLQLEGFALDLDRQQSAVAGPPVQNCVAGRLEHCPAGVGGHLGFIPALLPFKSAGQKHVDVVRAELVQPQLEVRAEAQVTDCHRAELGDPDLGVEAPGRLQHVDEVGVEVLGEHEPGLIQVRAVQCGGPGPAVGFIPGQMASPRHHSNRYLSFHAGVADTNTRTQPGPPNAW